MPDTLIYSKPVHDTVKTDSVKVSEISPAIEKLTEDTTNVTSEISTQGQQTTVADSPQIQIVTPIVAKPAPQSADTIISTVKQRQTSVHADSSTVLKTTELQTIFGIAGINSGVENKSIIFGGNMPSKQLQQIAPFEIYGNESVSPNACSDNIFVHSPINYKQYDSYKSATVIGLIIIFALLLISSGKYIPDMIRMMSSYRLSNKRYAENFKSYVHNRVFFCTFSLFIMPLFLYLSYRSLVNPDYIRIDLIYIILSGIWLFQAIAVKICGTITFTEDLINEVNFNKQLISGVAGIILFPIVVIMLLYDNPAINDTMLKTGVIVLSVLVLFMIIRIFTIFFAARISSFQFFLYLCIFEISPYLALYIVFQ